MALSSSSAQHTRSRTGARAAGDFEREALSTLRKRLEAHYELALQRLTIAGSEFTLTVVRDTNALLDRIRPEDFARDERLPYWAEIWTSSLELARWSLDGGITRGMRVLELGCGLGLVGIAAARAGALVTMTDYEPDALDFARLNVAENLPVPPSGGAPRVTLLDWRTPYRGERFRRVLGSDIAYDRSLFEPLLRCLDECLTPGGQVILAEPDRAIGRAFLELAEHSGFSVEKTAIPTSRNGRTVTVVRSVLRRSSPR